MSQITQYVFKLFILFVLFLYFGKTQGIRKMDLTLHFNGSIEDLTNPEINLVDTCIDSNNKAQNCNLSEEFCHTGNYFCERCEWYCSSRKMEREPLLRAECMRPDRCLCKYLTLKFKPFYNCLINSTK